MTFILNNISRPELYALYKQSMHELENFFDFKFTQNPPNFILLPDRNSFDTLTGSKTEDWVVGLTLKGNVYLLDQEHYEKESSHKYSEEKYLALAKHELVHCFTNVVASGCQKPVWLIEGISIYLSGQNKFKKTPQVFNTFIEFYNKGGAGVYAESGFVVELLVKKYGKDRLIELLRRASEAKSQKEFADLFRSIYKLDLSYESIESLK